MTKFLFCWDSLKPIVAKGRITFHDFCSPKYSLHARIQRFL